MRYARTEDVMSMRKAESAWYATVQRFLKTRFGCFDTATNRGTRYGRVDVVGIRDVGGTLSGAFELIAVEVKGGGNPFATAAGQAYGYSVYAERCYLADCREGKPAFSLDEIDIAGSLGVGLLAIRNNGRVVEVLASPQRTPMVRMRSDLLYKLGYAECSLCRTPFKHGGAARTDERVTRWYVKDAVRMKRAFVYWLSDVNARKKDGRKHNYERRYLCRDCVWNMYDEFVDDAPTNASSTPNTE
jgi:hypothetical protein